MAERADFYLFILRQGTDYVWLAGITKYIIDQDWHDKKFLAENVKNFDGNYSKIVRKVYARLYRRNYGDFLKLS